MRIKEVKSNNYLVEEYCRRIGITVRQYYYWHKKIKDIAGTGEVPVTNGTSFAELTFKEEDARNTGLSITFGNSIKIVPEKGFNEVEFIRLAKILLLIEQC